MKIIGITGGVGAGKTEVLSLIKRNCKCKIVLADELANSLKEPGQSCYEKVVELLGTTVLDPDGTINKKRMAERIFRKDAHALLEQVNQIIHPMVRQEILALIQEETERKCVDYFFIEAALLLEDGYREICDEIWFIKTDRTIREKRLIESRGYSKEKIMQIMEKQFDDQTFEQLCDEVINNSEDLIHTEHQIKLLIQKKQAENS
ncbi:MAG: dephospho-CoA kinase [Clostridia bacterium]|nr:dephospho-CoA kinase [Clostridia bacterium]